MRSDSPRLGCKARSPAIAASVAGHGAAQSARMPFPQWVASFRARALARGFLRQDLRPRDGRPQARHVGLSLAAGAARIPGGDLAIHQPPRLRLADQDRPGGGQAACGAARAHRAEYGVDRYILLALWGVESAYGDPIVQQNYMRPVFPALAALAWGEPRRRAYWEAELLNALVIVERGWSTPAEMRGSWAGAMGHTQWMPEVWLHIGLDYDRDGRVSPFGSPADALASTARYLVERGKYRRGEHWGYEIRGGSGRPAAHLRRVASDRRPACQRRAVPKPNATARPWVPVPGGPAFLIGQNFQAVHSYNPSMNYTLAICHLSDRIRGDGPFVQPFPGSERTPTLAEIAGVAAAPDQGRLRHRRPRRPGRHRHHAGRARLSAEGRPGAGRRLRRAQGAGAIAAGDVAADQKPATIIPRGCHARAIGGASSKPETASLRSLDARRPLFRGQRLDPLQRGA